MPVTLRKPSRRRAAVYGSALETAGKVVGALPIGPAPRRRFPFTLRRPSRRRANVYGVALQAAGSAIGALPVTVRPERRTIIRVVAPVAGVVLLVAVVRMRSGRGSQDGTQDATAPFESASPSTYGSSSPDPAAVGEPPSVSESPLASPPTETEREKAQVANEQLPPTPGDTPHAAASETPAAGEAGLGGGAGE